MRIQLDKHNHYLCSDAHSAWIAVERKSKTGTVSDLVVSGYHRQVNDVVVSYIEGKIRSSEATKISELNKEVQALIKQVRSWEPVIKAIDLGKK